MGLFRFECCGEQWVAILRGEQISVCKKCGQGGMRVYSPPTVPVVYEIRDNYRGTKMRQDMNRQAAERSHKHAIMYESTNIIAEHGLDAAKKAGYLNEKGSKKTLFDEK